MRYITALDVGTTTVRCYILDESANTISCASEKIELLYPELGHVEIDPDKLWDLVIKTIREALHGSGIDLKDIAGLGISTQRGSFINWNPANGRHYHKFITWKDLRADALVKEWNQSLTLKGLRFCSRILYFFTRNKRYLMASVFKFMNTQITLRLLWVLKHVPGLREAALNGRVAFGGVDCWLLYKLTGKHMSDVSSASATGLFDPFLMQWSGLVLNMVGIPHNILPEIVNTTMNFGVIPRDIFDIEIPIFCCVSFPVFLAFVKAFHWFGKKGISLFKNMADQSASLFGSGCFQSGDLKITMGTGSFVNVNTTSEPHASVIGLYPVVGWRTQAELVFIAEGSSNDTGLLIEWMQSLGMFEHVDESSDLANSVDNSDGVYFIPAFSGLQAPINDQRAATGFIGIKPSTNKAHLIRSLLESLVFRIRLLVEVLHAETVFTYEKIRVDGGVSKNDFILQLLADLTGLKVERATNTEMSILGVAFLAGLHCGVWNSKDELSNLRRVEKIFVPNEEIRLRYVKVISEWKRAVERFKKWY